MPHTKVRADEIDETLLYEEHSALFWSTHLGDFADDIRTRADNFAIAAALLSALTGAAVWTTVADSHAVWAQLLVTVAALTAAFVALVPKLKDYNAGAEKATDLAAEYGDDLVSLRFAIAHRAARGDAADAEVRKAIAKFEKTRGSKEHLHPRPKQLQRQLNEEREQQGIARRDGRMLRLPG